MEYKDCQVCNGSGVRKHDSFTAIDGKRYEAVEYKCVSCEGRGIFDELNETAILTAIKATKGKNKGRLRASMTSPLRGEGVEAARSYYVWRVARFHGGVDVTLPVMAEMVVRGDPYRDDLEKIADRVAQESFGTKYAAAARWGRALGMI